MGCLRGDCPFLKSGKRDEGYECKGIKENKKKYLDLLLLADEQEDRIDRYLGTGTMDVVEDDGGQS